MESAKNGVCRREERWQFFMLKKHESIVVAELPAYSNWPYSYIFLFLFLLDGFKCCSHSPAQKQLISKMKSFFSFFCSKSLLFLLVKLKPEPAQHSHCAKQLKTNVRITSELIKMLLMFLNIKLRFICIPSFLLHFVRFEF